MHSHGQHAADHTGCNVEPIPSRPIPIAHRNMVSVVVVHVLELHAASASDTHENGAEQRHDKDAYKVFPAVAHSQPFW